MASGMANVTASTPSDGFSTKPYPAAIAYSFCSLLVILLNIVPLIWQVRNRNIAGFALMFWLALSNFMSFINAIIWPHDDVSTWFYGRGLCDVEVRVNLAAIFGAEVSLILLFKGLAEILDTKNTVVGYSSAQKKRKAVIESLLCFGMPLLYGILYYVVQPRRYDIYGIVGCGWLVSDSWVSVVLVTMWPPLLNVISGGFACEYPSSSNAFHSFVN